MKKLLLVIMLLFMNGCVNSGATYDIEDREPEGMGSAAVMEDFYEDEENVYSFGHPKAGWIFVIDKETKEETPLIEALEEGMITIEDLEEAEIFFYKTKKVE